MAKGAGFLYVLSQPLFERLQMKRYLLRNLGHAALGVVRYPFYLTVGGVAAWAVDKILHGGF
jgi:hypothetical protein